MKLSIITINKNNASGLEKTCLSIASQTNKDFEWIVIDGASTDESLEIINKYEKYINYWISEPDSGVYNAMNKGIKKANGEYCLFLNSGDLLVNINTINDLYIELKYTESAGIYYTYITYQNGKISKFSKKLQLCELILGPLNHQNMIIKRSLFIEHGLYNENLNIFSDYEFCLNELWKYKTKFIFINTRISIYDETGISSTNHKLRSIEFDQVIKNVFNELSELLFEYRIYRTSYYYKLVYCFNNKALSRLIRLLTPPILYKIFKL